MNWMRVLVDVPVLSPQIVIEGEEKYLKLLENELRSLEVEGLINCPILCCLYQRLPTLYQKLSGGGQ